MPTRKSPKTLDEQAERRKLEEQARKREAEERRLKEHNEAVRRSQAASGASGKPGRVFAKPRPAPAPKFDPTVRTQTRAASLGYSMALPFSGMPHDAPHHCPNCGAAIPSYLGQGRYHCQVNRLVTKNYGCDHTWDGPMNPSETRYKPPGAARAATDQEKG